MKRKILGFVFAAFSAMFFIMVIYLIIDGVPRELGFDEQRTVNSICIALVWAFILLFLAIKFFRKKKVPMVEDVVNYNVNGGYMGFVKAIDTCVFKKYADFKGTASKSEFWWFWLFYFGIPISMFIVHNIFGTLNGGVGQVGLGLFGTIFMYVVIIYMLGLLCPYLAVCIRRLHDSGLSGWHILWCLIPTFGFFIFIYLMSRNHRGNMPPNFTIRS